MQDDRCFLCGQMELPPHSTQDDRCFLCGQMELPPHSTHSDRRFLCGQMELPPHSTQRDRFFLCGQYLRHVSHRDAPTSARPCMHLPAGDPAPLLVAGAAFFLMLAVAGFLVCFARCVGCFGLRAGILGRCRVCGGNAARRRSRDASWRQAVQG